MSTTRVSYKELWARFVSEQKLKDDFEALGHEPTQDECNTIFEEKTGLRPDDPTSFKIGIVGAGCAGLFTGMIIDFINRNVKGLNIQYEILEAASKERLGGRLYTYNFPVKADSPKGPHDYYDVGAMRFPKIPIMDRTFELFKEIGIGEDKIVPYYLKDELKVCPSYFNDHRLVGPQEGQGSDPYHLNKSLPKHFQIPEDLMALGPDVVIGEAIKEFKMALKKDIDDKKMRGGKTHLWSIDAKPVKGKGYSYSTVQWLETFEYGTGWYDQSLAETVLESMDFDYPINPERDPQAAEAAKEGGAPKVEWKCIEGGTQQVAKAMAKTLKTKPLFGKVVTSIATNEKKTMLVTVKGETQPRKYFAVFNSTTLGALQQMDLTGANLSYGTKQAIRSLGYGASCKIGIKFSHHWWMQEPYNIKKGGMARTDLPLRVCVYPSYNLEDPSDEPAVLLCSYTWAQDAQRIGSLITPESPKGEDTLLKLMFHNLALLHSPSKAQYQDTYDTIEQSYLDHHAYDWYNDPLMSGAFAYFGPGQFSQMWPEIITPTGWLYLIGEAASTHHAWIVGALESAVRAVFQMFTTLHKQTKLEPEAPERELYWRALELLKSDESGPFGPLPLGVKEEVAIGQAALGFIQAQAEEDRKKATTNGH